MPTLIPSDAELGPFSPVLGPWFWTNPSTFPALATPSDDLSVPISLGAGMFSMVKNRSNSNRTVKFLSLRIALSILLFVFIAFSFYMGWIQPHGIVPPKS